MLPALLTSHPVLLGHELVLGFLLEKWHGPLFGKGWGAQGASAQEHKAEERGNLSELPVLGVWELMLLTK